MGSGLDATGSSPRWPDQSMGRSDTGRRPYQRLFRVGAHHIGSCPLRAGAIPVCLSRLHEDGRVTRGLGADVRRERLAHHSARGHSAAHAGPSRRVDHLVRTSHGVVRDGAAPGDPAGNSRIYDKNLRQPLRREKPVRTRLSTLAAANGADVWPDCGAVEAAERQAVHHGLWPSVSSPTSGHRAMALGHLRPYLWLLPGLRHFPLCRARGAVVLPGARAWSG